MSLPTWLEPLPDLTEWVPTWTWLAETLLANALGVAVLALVVATVSSRIDRPALRHGLWLVVLLRAVMPPLVPLQVLPEPIATLVTVPTDETPATLAAQPPGSLTSEVSFSAEGVVLSPQPTMLPFAVPESHLPALEHPPFESTRLAASGAAADPITPPGQPLLSSEGPWAVLLARGPQWLLALWLVGSTLVAAVALLRIAAFGRRLRSTRVAEPWLQERAREIAQALGLRRCPVVLTTDLRMPPLVWAPLGRPRLVLSQPLLDRLSAAERDTVLAHELAHVARRDHWTRGLELVTGILFWWHPAVAWARRQLRLAEEQCCDEKVVELLPHQARAYAEALLETLDLTARPPAVPPIPALASGLEPRNRTLQQLEGRLSMILKPTSRRQLPTFVRLVLAAAVALALVLLPTRSTQAAGGGEGGDPARDQRAAQMAEAEREQHQVALEALERERERERRAQEAVEREREHERIQEQERYVAEAHAKEREAHAALEREQLALEQEALRMEERARQGELERHEAEMELRTRRRELANQALEARLEQAQAMGDREEAEQLLTERRALQAEAEIEAQELALHRERLATELELHQQQLDLELEARRQLLEGDPAQHEAVRELQRALEQRRLGRDQELQARELALREKVLAREKQELETLRTLAERGDQVVALKRHEAELERQRSAMTQEFALRRLQTSAEMERLRLEEEVEAGRLSRDKAEDTLRQLHQKLEAQQRGMLEHHIESQIAQLRAEIPEQLATMRRQLEDAGAADTELAQSLETLRQTLEEALGDL